MSDIHQGSNEIKKYMVLTARVDMADYLLEGLDSFEDHVNLFLENRNAELVGGISMLVVNETIYLAQALLVVLEG